jgi:hypothetical protein
MYQLKHAWLVIGFCHFLAPGGPLFAVSTLSNEPLVMILSAPGVTASDGEAADFNLLGPIVVPCRGVRGVWGVRSQP